MNDREVMRQALDRLEIVALQMLKPQDVKVVQALRTALEQPEQEPVAWMYSDDHERMLETETFCTVYSVKVGSPDKGVTDVPLYTTAVQRKSLRAVTYVCPVCAASLERQE